MMQLYVWDQCPFCHKVLQAAAEIGLTEGQDFQSVAAGPGTPGRLLVQSLGGKAMVPFLVDGETKLYESDDIIAYLRTHTDE